MFTLSYTKINNENDNNANYGRPGPVKEYNFNKNHNNRVTVAKELERVNRALDPNYNYRNPTVNNPMMNVPIVSYDSNQLYSDYNRYLNGNPSNNTEQIANAVERDLNNNLFQDAGGFFFQRENSQRQWYSVPSGSVPNDQESFASWLYMTPGNCKNGSIWSNFAPKFTDDSLLCTGNSAASPTNFGLLEK